MQLVQVVHSIGMGLRNWLFIRRAGLVILGYGLFLTLPAGWSGFVTTTDSLNHLIMSRHFVDQLWSGDFYPRWLFGMNAGLGSPVFQFYGPVPYYITALFRPLLGHDPEGWLQLGLAASLAVIASGFTAYAWLKRLAGERAALIGAVLYMSAPYHLAVDLYQRFFFAELWGFVWMPLIMLCARESMCGGKGAMAGLSLIYALLIMTHLPTTLLFSWVPVAYVLWMAEPGDRLGPFVRLAGGMLLGMGLSAVFLLPAMSTQQYVLFGQMESGFYYFSNHFLFCGPRLNDARLNEYLRYLGIVVSLMLFVSFAAWQLGRLNQQAEERRESTFWMLSAAICFFMQIYLSKPLWEGLAILQTVQFPGRFNTVFTLAMAVLVASWVSSKAVPSVRGDAAMWVIVALLLLLHSLPVLKGYAHYRLWSTTPTLVSLVTSTNKMRVDTKVEANSELDRAAVLLEAAKISRYNFFLPRWSNPDLFVDTPEGVRAMRELATRTEKAVLVEGTGSVMVKHWQPPHIELAVKAETALRLGLLQLYYPGWVARLDVGSTRLEVGSYRPDGLLEVKVPAGTHRILIGREPLPEERAGQIISGVSLVGLAVFSLWPCRRRSLNKACPESYVC